MSRVLTEVLARRLDEDLALTEELLALMPAGQQEWRPDWPLTAGGEPTFTVEALARHLVMAWSGVVACLRKLHPEKLGHLDALQQELAQNQQPPVASCRALLGALRRHIGEGFALTADVDLSREIPTYFTPRGEPLLETLLGNAKHSNHHAHQLFVYLKLLGVPVETRHLYRFREERLG